LALKEMRTSPPPLPSLPVRAASLKVPFPPIFLNLDDRHWLSLGPPFLVVEASQRDMVATFWLSMEKSVPFPSSYFSTGRMHSNLVFSQFVFRGRLGQPFSPRTPNRLLFTGLSSSSRESVNCSPLCPPLGNSVTRPSSPL